MVIIYIICNRINIKKAIFTVILVFISLFLFGLAGDLRTRAQIGDESEFDSSVLMEVTAANPTLLENESLHPLYWSYIYISSPLANFQNTINEFNDKDGSTFDNTLFFVLYEIIPDHITNKIALFANYDEHFSPLSRIIEFLTVGTIFADSFAFIGWFGPVILAFLFLSTPIIIYKITPKNNLYIIQMSICSTILALCTFSNMLVYSSWTLQFIYPLVLSLSIKR